MVKEGYGYGLPLLLIAGALFGLRIYIPAIIFLIAAIFVLNFFRDPERHIPADPGALVSPADGRVVQIVEEEFDGCLMQRLSIFMSPLNVHVNRAPIAGTVTKVAYTPGAFHVASKGEASVENEQNVFTIAGEQGVVHVKQIAGALARRIVFWKRPGDDLARGERVGLIKFGSRVDILAGQGIEWRVKVGDSVKAGSTVLGFTKPKA
ncbi:MAG TPA: phosphatidylserine decarboxylase [Terriglobia bacterium]|nr:phosphatidylserine decarboxylase [Terriglobia bacterium]